MDSMRRKLAAPNKVSPVKNSMIRISPPPLSIKICLAFRFLICYNDSIYFRKWIIMRGKPLDLVGQRFGRLTVLERLGANARKEVVWRCQCDCGSVVDVPTRNLRSRGTVSCGCNRREKSTANFEAHPREEKLGLANGSSLSRLRAEKPPKNNTTGYRGVSKLKSGNYIGYVYYQRKQYRAGIFSTPEEAAKAVEQLRAELVEKHLDSLQS